MNEDAGQPSDEEIIQRVLDGDIDAYEVLVHRYDCYVYTVALRYGGTSDGADLAHDAMVRAYQALPKLRDPRRFKSWLAGITVRLCYDYWRDKNRRHERALDTLDTDQTQWLDQVSAGKAKIQFSDEEQRQRTAELAHWALDSLGAADRMLVQLVYFEGRSLKETASLLDWSVVNTKVRLSRARRKLRGVLRRALDKGKV